MCLWYASIDENNHIRVATQWQRKPTIIHMRFIYTFRVNKPHMYCSVFSAADKRRDISTPARRLVEAVIIKPGFVKLYNILFHFVVQNITYIAHPYLTPPIPPDLTQSV